MSMFTVKGYAVSRRGRTKGFAYGFAYQVEAEDATTAREAAADLALKKGMTFLRVLAVIPVPETDNPKELTQ